MKKSIKQLISEGESQFLELKREFNEGVLKTISAFANTGGGTLLIGVSDKKEVIGIDLKGLVDRNIFIVKGKGRGLHYVINEFGN